MIGQRFVQAVEPNDLIMIYPGIPKPNWKESATMYVVISAPVDGDSHPLTSSITVREIDWYLPQKHGNWLLDGPYVDFRPVGPEQDPDFYNVTGQGSVSLKEILEKHTPGDTPDACQECVRVWVNPHGRDVLKYYFNGNCPFCCASGCICAGCGGISETYPEIFGSCGTDQACPMCLGLDHAIQDRGFLLALETLEEELYRHEDAKRRMMELSKANATQDGTLPDYKDNILSDSMVDHWKRELLELTERRLSYENERKREMGLEERDLDQVIRETKGHYPFVFLDGDDDEH